MIQTNDENTTRVNCGMQFRWQGTIRFYLSSSHLSPEKLGKRGVCVTNQMARQIMCNFLGTYRLGIRL